MPLKALSFRPRCCNLAAVADQRLALGEVDALEPKDVIIGSALELEVRVHVLGLVGKPDGYRVDLDEDRFAVRCERDHDAVAALASIVAPHLDARPLQVRQVSAAALEARGIVAAAIA